MTKSYILASNKSWHIDTFYERRANLPGRWAAVLSTEDLVEIARALKPRFVFFPHWSSLVPRDFVQEFECVCFHMTDVPYGRGGSPLQNLIVRGHERTKLSALRMTPDLDAGPVYLKLDLSLNGTAQEIFDRASKIMFQMIRQIVREEPAAMPQTGEVTVFPRRKPAESELPLASNARGLYDHIRMLDAETYPRAFLDVEGWRIEFSDARLTGESIDARARFAPRPKSGCGE